MSSIEGGLRIKKGTCAHVFGINIDGDYHCYKCLKLQQDLRATGTVWHYEDPEIIHPCCDPPHDYKLDEIEDMIVCHNCGLIQADIIFQYKRQFIDMRDKWKNQQYDALAYIEEKCYRICGMSKEIEADYCPGERVQIVEAIKECTTWKEVRRKLMDIRKASRIIDVPHMINRTVYMPGFAGAFLHRTMQESKKSKGTSLRFEFIFAKILLAIDHPDWIWVPCYFSPPYMKKYEKEYARIIKGTEWEEFNVVITPSKLDFRVFYK